MQAIFYKNISKFINSTKRPDTTGDAYNIKLKNAVSMKTPVFLMNVVDYSYNYLQWNDRYYFINDIIPISNNLCEYHCIYDELATYKTDIGTSVQYVLRAASESDGNIIDSLYPAKVNITTNKITFDTIHELLGVTLGTSVLQGGWVLGIINGSGSISGGSVTYYYLTASQFAQFKAFMFKANPDWLGIDPTEISIALQKALIDPFQYVVSCVWYPFSTWSGYGTEGTIQFGWWSSGLSAYVLGNADRLRGTTQEIQLPRHPKAGTRGNYLNGSPFSRYTLNMYTFGQIPIDASYFVTDNKLKVSLYIDIFANVGKLVIYAHKNNEYYEIATYTGQIGSSVTLSQLKQDVIRSASSLLGGAVSLGTRGDVLGFASGIESAIESLSPHAEISGSNGSQIDYAIKPFLLSEFSDIVDENNIHRGRPLCKEKRINTLNGYILCADAEVDFAKTPDEKIAIRNYMESGFFYE